jgi:hypothetical protein
MENLFDRVGLAFLRLFGDLAGGNLSDVLLSDVGIVAAVVAAPLLMIYTVVSGPRN